MSACSDVLPVLTMDRIRDRKHDIQRKLPEREKRKASSQLTGESRLVVFIGLITE